MTWDRDLMLRWGEAMGAEFWGKGANVQLGPGVCVARIPKCVFSVCYFASSPRAQQSPPPLPLPPSRKERPQL